MRQQRKDRPILSSKKPLNGQERNGSEASKDAKTRGDLGSASTNVSRSKDDRSSSKPGELDVTSSISNANSSAGDSAALYLREMGKSSLLTKEEEVSLAQQIEDWQEVIKEAILEIPFALIEIRKFCRKSLDRTLNRISRDQQPVSVTSFPIQKSKRLSLLERVIEFLEKAEIEMRNCQQSLRQNLSVDRETALTDRVRRKKQESMKIIDKIRLSQDDVWKIVTNLKNLLEEVHLLEDQIEDAAGVDIFDEMSVEMVECGDTQLTPADARDSVAYAITVSSLSFDIPTVCSIIAILFMA